MRGRGCAALLVAAVLLVGCSSDDGDSSAAEDTGSGITTVPPSIVPLTTTTTIEGTPVSDAEIYAQVGLTVEQGACIARNAVLAADWPETVTGVTLNRFCGSGAQAVNFGAMGVMSGQQELVVAGGVESMSRVPIGSDGGAWAQDPETNSATAFVPQGIGADLIATLAGWGREDVDRFALTSQQRAAAAQAAGHFDRSVIAVEDEIGLPVLERDEFLKPRTTLEGLAQLKPAFAEMGAMGFDAVALARST